MDIHEAISRLSIERNKANNSTSTFFNITYETCLTYGRKTIQHPRQWNINQPTIYRCWKVSRAFSSIDTAWPEWSSLKLWRLFVWAFTISKIPNIDPCSCSETPVATSMKKTSISSLKTKYNSNNNYNSHQELPMLIIYKKICTQIN